MPNPYEKFMTFASGDLKLIDFADFMASSLEEFTENLYDDKNKFNVHLH